MSQHLKALNPKVAKDVGVIAAMVFQHICYWMQSQSTDVIFRTNKDLADDLESISPSQVQRAKKKLIDAGYIVVSKESKYSWIRTTYYRLTKKGEGFVVKVKKVIKELLKTPREAHVEHSNSSIKDEVAQSHQSNDKEAKTNSKVSSTQWWIPKHKYREHMIEQQRLANQNKEQVISESMVKLFDEGMVGNKNAVPIPEHLLNNPKLAKMYSRSKKRG